MRVPHRNRGSGLRFNITPLIDIVFLLVVFFLVTSHFVRTQEVDRVELPDATQTEDEEATPRRMVVNVLAGGQIRVNGRDVDIPFVEEALRRQSLDAGPNFEVQIRADRRIPYSEIEPILLACSRNGITRVGFRVVRRSTSQSG
ncbi:MAG: ExbD/TolR family protein [Maioricimonas sp. JB049]